MDVQQSVKSIGDRAENATGVGRTDEAANCRSAVTRNAPPTAVRWGGRTPPLLWRGFVLTPHATDVALSPCGGE